MITLPISTLGRFAAEILPRANTGTVLGVTSQGIFLRTTSEHALFISYGRFRSPVALIFGSVEPEDLLPLQQLSNGDNLTIMLGMIAFSTIRLALDFSRADTWHRGAPPLADANPGAILHRMQSLARKVTAHKAGEMGFCPLLLPLLNLPPTAPFSSEDSLALSLLLPVQERLRLGNVRGAVGALPGLLGMGRGLTPSGDDFAAGILLALNRWGHYLRPAFDVERFNRAVIALSRQKTTTLSATLIECAARGEADERLIAALDYLFSGSGDEDDITDHLVKLGHSSGIDTLAGILAISC